MFVVRRDKIKPYMARTETKDEEKNRSKKPHQKSKQPEEKEPLITISEQTKYGIFSLVFFVLALFFIAASFHRAGPAGDATYSLFKQLFGIGYFLVPTTLILLGASFIRTERANIMTAHMVSSTLVMLGGLGIIDIVSTNTLRAGGYIGHIVAWPFVKLFEKQIGILFLSTIVVISLVILFDKFPNFAHIIERIREARLRRKIAREATVVDTTEDNDDQHAQAPETRPEPPQQEPEEVETVSEEELSDDIPEMMARPKKVHSVYVPPPLSLLERDKGKPNVGDIKANSNIIKRTLENFGILVEMDEITIGPTVTRYALKPAQGVKVSRIVALQNDLGLALAAHPIRIEAPIPGKSLVGIEVPNKTKATVGLASLLSDEKFQHAQKPLTVALGRNISGKNVFSNVAKMPHGLIAGTTGSGKSVAIHAVITSLLYRNGPEELRLIMVDPKRVELTLYNKIPHLLTPVITDAKKAILALKWAAKEMDRRYDILQAESVQNIESYHDGIVKQYKPNKNDPLEAGAPDKMPYIVIVIDELADIMQAFPRELESAIVRLAQMSRAVGIHLILSTQRPDVNVITGLIKANIPTRVALKVASQIDSRTILDATGAEKLLGAGDMLYSSGDGQQPERLQSAFISEDEVKKVVKYLSETYRDELPSTIELTGTVTQDKSIFESSMEESTDDDLYEEARVTVIQTGKASTSFLQRKLGIGYARAARLIDILEERGIVGPGNGAKPREVLERPQGSMQESVEDTMTTEETV